MHHSLSIPEIVDLIFAELQPEHVFGRQTPHWHRKDFAALARTCKSFKDPALNFLWREQDTLTNILKCLPSHLWKETWVRSANHNPRRQLHLTGQIVPADWDVALTYASRIRTLISERGNSGGAFPAASVFEIITSTIPCPHLCPNLRRVSWNLENPDPNSLLLYLGLFLGPHIIDVEISLSRKNSEFDVAALPALPLPYPQLTNLALQGLYDDPILSCRAASIVVPSTEQNSPNRGSRSHSFPALRTVEFPYSTFEFSIEFLNMLSNCRLDSVHIGTGHLTTKSMSGQLHVALASHLSHTALDSLAIEFVGPGRAEQPTGTIAHYVISGRELAPLFCFVNLTNLWLEPPVGFDIDDSMAWDMAHSWPKLTSLRFTTLHGLRGFAKHCKESRSLTIPLDASTVPPFDNSPETRISQSSLNCLLVGRSPIVDQSAVARFMRRLFPNLTEIEINPEDEAWDSYEEVDTEEARTFADRWQLVQNILRQASRITVQ
ncbi:hypothetical protein B0H11DRAFT_2099813 [Mycena galericulata]|nr:hypothetical protein B0H11DRAFT_2099813 [Mycena galericulata]